MTHINTKTHISPKKRFGALGLPLLAASLLAASCPHAQGASVAQPVVQPVAVNAYTDIAGDISPSGIVVNPLETVGFQFTPVRGGKLSSFAVAVGSENGGVFVNGQLINTGTTAEPFTLSLYADSSGTLGKLLGTYGGMTKQYYGDAGLVVVPAGGVTLTAGKKYWLVAACSTTSVVWNYVDDAQPAFFTVYGYPSYGNLQSSAFSVQVKP